jgi:flavin-dependent dehydrogenase
MSTSPRLVPGLAQGALVEKRFDVVIIGGGPSGTTCGVRLARRGRKVLILERSKFPRFHIGESITAFGFTVFDDLGVFSEVQEINQVKKKGLEFVMHDKTHRIYFGGPDPKTGERPFTFQMARHKLDQVLLENARKQGVTVCEEHLVKRVLFEGGRAVGVEYKDLASSDPDTVHRIYAKWIIDASGQGAVLNRQLKDNWYPDPLLDRKMAIFCHWKGDIEVTNTDEDINFKLCVHKNRRDWAWYIPIAKDTLSLGIVLSQETLKQEMQTKGLAEIFYSYAKDIPYISELLENPTLKEIEKFRCVKDYSYRSKRYCGNGWAICGDSAGFIDPVFSTGLQVAFNSAYALTDSLDPLLDQENPDLSRLEGYNRALDRYYRVSSMLVYLYYLAELDERQYRSGMYLWKHIQWASVWDRLAFVWHGLRYLRADRKTRSRWGAQVLFGNPENGNVVADLYMAISRNYDKLVQDKVRDVSQGSPLFEEA